MHIKVYNYEMLNFNGENIVFSEKGISKVNSTSVWAALKELTELTELEFDAHELDNLLIKHSLPVNDARCFLEKILKINHSNQGNYYDQIILAHDLDCDNFIRSILNEESSNQVKFVNIKNLDIAKLKGAKVFLHFHVSNYDYETLKGLYFSAAKLLPDSAISVSYYAPDLFVFSQPFIPELGNACHFCAIDRLIDYESVSAGHNVWAKLLTFGKTQRVPLPQKKLTTLQLNLAIGLLARRIAFFTQKMGAKRHQDSIYSCSTINLKTGSISEEVIPHWFRCKCLGDVR